MESPSPDSFFVQIQQPQAKENHGQTPLNHSRNNNMTSTTSFSEAGNKQVMFSRKLENDPLRENMAISIVSIFFCCFVGILATFKAAKALESNRRNEIHSAERDTLMARKLAISAIVGGLTIYVVCLLIHVFFIRKGDYKTIKYGHVHLYNISLHYERSL